MTDGLAAAQIQEPAAGPIAPASAAGEITPSGPLEPFATGIAPTTAPLTKRQQEGRRELHKAYASLRPRPSTDTTPVAFSVGGIRYRIPRDYIITMDNWNGGPQV